MAKEPVQIEGLEELLRKIQSLEDLKPIQASIEAAGEHLMVRVAKYPADNRPSRYEVYGETFKSDKQRRYLFWAIRNKKIKVPYERGQSPGSQTFSKRWTAVASNSGLTMTVGTNCKYAPLLMDEDNQSRYAARVGWETVQDIAEKEGPTLCRYILQAIDEELKK